MILPSLTFIFDRKGQSREKKEGLIELRISAGDDRKYISTGVRVRPKEWKDGSVVGRRDWHELNLLLDTFKEKASECVVRMIREGRLELGALPAMIRDSMVQTKTFLEYAEERAEEKYRNVSPRTRKHYEQFFRFAKEWKGIVYFSDVAEKNIMRMDDELRSRGLKTASRYCYHKCLKTFVLQAIGDGLVKRNPYVRLSIKKGDDNGLSKCLTPDEFHRFESCVIPMESLRSVRDLFVFQTYTMMSYCDLEAYDYSKCTKVRGELVYKARRQKNGQEFTVVLLEPALAILKRYGYKLPLISNQKYNLYLKAAVAFAHIDKPVTSHWARHTGATLLLNGGIPINIVQHILGHSTIRETEKTYAKLMDETIIEQMGNYQKRKFV